MTTSLTGDQLAELRELASHEAGRFTNPAVITGLRAWWRHDLRDWAAEVLGEPFSGDWQRLPYRAMYLLHLAHQTEPSPPEPPAIAARRAAAMDRREAAAAAQAAEEARQRAEWEALRAKLPVPVMVAHNYTSARHLAHFSQGADHIMLREDLHVGRLRRRAGQPLCYTPSRDKGLRHFDMSIDDERLPECKACLRAAHRVAGVAQ